MAEYIDKSALYEKIAQLEELARNSYLETPSNSQCYSRYMAQLNERTAFKHLIADFPAADVAPVRHGRWEQCFEDWRQQIEGDKCSVCGFEHYGASIKKYKYCPNCGTLMDLEGE